MDDITKPKQENTNRKQETPKWIVNLKNHAERIRTDIVHIQVIINWKTKQNFFSKTTELFLKVVQERT